MDTLCSLIGLIVKEVRFTDECFQLFFSDGSILSIYNNHFFYGDVFDVVKGCGVTKLEESNDEIKILFDSVTLVINMDNDAYVGPEALSLHRNGTIVVWN